MSITLKCGGTLFEAIDDVVLTCDANGMKLSFGVRARELTRLAVTPTPNTPLRSRSVIEMYDDTTRAFYGLVYDAAWDNEGLWRVEVRDLKYWLADATLWGRSLQVARDKRFARVKYAYAAAADSGGWLVLWTVGAIIQDVLNNMCAALAHDTPTGGISTPTLAEYFSSAVVDGMKHKYSYWSSTSFSVVSSWVTAITGDTDVETRSPWYLLTLPPFGIQFDGDTVAGAIDKLLKRYYPGWTWWVDPTTLVPAPVNVYGANPTTANTFDVASKQHRVLLEGLKRTLDGCWSRVIVQGQAASAVQAINPQGSRWLPGWIIGGSVQISLSGFIVNYQEEGGYVFTVQCTGYDPETQKLLIVRSPYGKFSMFSHSHTNNTWSEIFWDTLASGTTGQQVGYRKDDVWLHDTGYASGEGTAYTVLNLTRTLVLMDETVGTAVLLPNTDMTVGEHTLADRHSAGEAMAAGVLARVKDLRYSGRMVLRGGPQLNPHLRVKVENTDFGDIVAVPHSVAWRLSTGEREYQLGDNEYNPYEELQLLNEMRWRDAAHGRARYSAGGGTEAGNVPGKADDGSSPPPIT